jgi:hypothetical protein
MKPSFDIRSTDKDILTFYAMFVDVPVTNADQSIKISQTKIEDERILLCVPSYRISFDSIIKLLAPLGFPPTLHGCLQSQYYGSEFVYFGMEKTRDHRLIYKVYVEQALGLTKYEALVDNMKTTHPTIESYKWNTKIPESSMKQTTYSYMLQPTPDFIRMQIARHEIDYVPSFVKGRISSTGVDDYIEGYIITDDYTPRKAIDLSFVSPSLSIDDMTSDLEKFSKKNMTSALVRFKGLEPHHVSVGNGAAGESYITIYFRLKVNDI